MSSQWQSRAARFASLPILGLAACSFFSDFPDVEPLGGGGATGTTTGTTEAAPSSTSTGGSGPGVTSTSTTDVSSSSSGGGGAGSCVPETCLNCWPGVGACPDLEDSKSLYATPSDPGVQADSSLWVNDIVLIPASERYVGHVSSRIGNTFFQPPGGGAAIVSEGSEGLGFLLDAEGAPIVASRPCLADGSPSGEVFFMSGTRALDASANNDFVVIAGAYEGAALRFATAAALATLDHTMRCTDPLGEGVAEIEGPAAANGAAAIPFLGWFLEGDLVKGLTSTSPEAASSSAYLADVADSRHENKGRVVAIGAGSGDVFDENVDLNDDIFLVSADILTEEVFVLPVGRKVCDGDGHVSSLSGLKNAVAITGEGQLWIAGTGCASAPASATQSYLAQVETDADGVPTVVNVPMVFSGEVDGDAVSISELAVSDELVIVAGTFNGTPNAGGTPFPQTGQNGDGFVMAFATTDWRNDVEPLWFSWIAADGGEVAVNDLTVDGGRIFLAGSYASNLGVPPVETCFEGDELPSRAFFAELDSASGEARWARVEGFPIPAAPDTQGFFAQGTAIEGRSNDGVPDGLFAAVRSHGRMKLDCTEGETGDFEPARPLVTLRRFP